MKTALLESTETVGATLSFVLLVLNPFQPGLGKRHLSGLYLLPRFVAAIFSLLAKLLIELLPVG